MSNKTKTKVIQEKDRPVDWGMLYSQPTSYAISKAQLDDNYFFPSAKTEIRLTSKNPIFNLNFHGVSIDSSEKYPNILARMLFKIIGIKFTPIVKPVALKTLIWHKLFGMMDNEKK